MTIPTVVSSEGLYELQTRDEERVNAITHGVGLLLSLIGAAVLLSMARQHDLWTVVVCAVYGASLISLFGVSTFYHACPSARVKKHARVLDHCAIFVLIAGSYTPFMMLALSGWRGWSILAGVWLLAILGIRYKYRGASPFGGFSVALYLLMGWLIMLVWNPLAACMAPAALAWLVAGGVVYSLGVPFYAWRSLPYSHGIWHLFVLGGAACHYIAIAHLV